MFLDIGYTEWTFNKIIVEFELDMMLVRRSLETKSKGRGGGWLTEPEAESAARM